MPDNNIKVGAQIVIDAKSVEKTLDNIGGLIKRALNLDPANKGLQEMWENANQVYSTINKTNEALELEARLTKAIADQSQAQSYVDTYTKEKAKLENLIDVRTAKKQDTSKQREQLASLDENLQAAQALRDEYDQMVSGLQTKLDELKQSGADVDKSLTFDNAKVSASGLLELLKEVGTTASQVIEIAEQAQSKSDYTVQDYRTGKLDGTREVETANEAVSAYDKFYEALVSINEQYRSIHDDANQLARDFLNLGNFQGDEAHQEFERIATSTQKLIEEMTVLKQQFTELNTDAKSTLPQEEFEKFKESAFGVLSNVEKILDTLNYIPASGFNFNAETLEETAELYRAFREELEATYDAWQEGNLSDEQLELFEKGAVQEMLYQLQQIMTAEGELEEANRKLIASRFKLAEQPVTTVFLPPEAKKGVDDANHSVQRLIDKYNDLKHTMSDFMSGKIELNDEQFRDLQQALAQTKAEVNALSQNMNEASSSTSKMAETSSRVRGAVRSGTSALDDFGKSASKAFKQGTSSAMSFLKSIGSNMLSSLRKLKNTIEKTFSGRSFKRGLTTVLKYGFGIRSLYFAFRRLRTAIKEGLKNLVQFESAMGTSKNLDSVNKAITSLNTSLLYLKNAWAAAISPVITYVMPILTSLVDKFAQVGNAIARFVGVLTGQSVVLNAVKVDAQDYADSLDKSSKSADSAAGSAKKLSDRLASFDDLNVLGKDSDGGGSGGGAGDLDAYVPDPSEMFEYVDAQSKLADMLKDAWEKSDFSELGETIKNKIISALPTDEDWAVIQEYVNKGATSIGTFLQGLLGDPALFEKIGHSAGQALNTITYGIQTLLEETKDIKFGENLGKGINEFLKTTDFETAGSNVHETIKQITDNINDLVNTISSDDVVNAITDFLDGLEVADIATMIQRCVLEVAELVIEVTGKLIVHYGEKLGESWWKDVTEGISTDVGGIPVELKPWVNADEHPIQAAVDALLTRIGEHVSKNPIKLAAQITGVDETTITSNLSDIVNRFIESPTKLFADITGITDKVTEFTDAWSQINFENFFGGFEYDLEQIGFDFDAFSDTFQTFKDDFLLGWDALKGTGGMLWDDFLLGAQAVQDWIDGFESDWDDFCGLWEDFDIETFGESLGESVSTYLIEPIAGWTETLNGWVSDSIDSLGQLKDEGTQKMTEFGDNLSLKWDEFKTTAEEKWANLKSAVSTKAGEIRDNVTEKIGDLKTKLAEKWQEIKDTTYEKLVLMKSAVMDVFNTLKEGLKTPINGIIGAVESMINKLIDGLNKLIGYLNALPDVKITNPFTGTEYSLGFSLPTLNNVSIPRLAQGAVIPPNKEFLAMLGDQTSGTNIEAPLDTIKQAVAEVMANNGSAEMIQLLQQLITVVENKNLTIGDKDIGKANARYTAQQSRIRGTSF